MAIHCRRPFLDGDAVRYPGPYLWALPVFGILFQPADLTAQQEWPSTSLSAAAGPADFGEALPEIDGPPPPSPPEMIRRDERNNATVRATRLTRPLDIDG